MSDLTHCHTCGKVFVATEHSPGYGEDKEGFRHCFACCALLDAQAMRRTGKATLYLSDQTPGVDRPRLTNWPGTLSITPTRVKRAKVRAFGHLIDRYDVWFIFEGTQWWGVNQGNNQICRCRKLGHI
jgi:hypothetical protein